MSKRSIGTTTVKILQVCNVGNICGGTAACAWTITHVFPEADHTVIFLSQPTAETFREFAHCHVRSESSITPQRLAEIEPDLLILHNTAPDRISGQSRYFSIQYHHSKGQRAPATLEVACSQWLAKQCVPGVKCLYQPVPIPRKPTISSSRNLSDEVIIGRICTPTSRKWPGVLIDLYQQFAARFPDVRWEFVGAPPGLQRALQQACRNRARFHQAGFASRQHLWSWHGMLYHHPGITESFGRTVAEAMRAGCLPIVDARGGFLEQVASGETGFLCRNSAEFMTAIEALHDRSRTLQMSVEAMASAGERFSLEAFLLRLRTLFSDGTLPVHSANSDKMR